jgi:hypothetical protein
MLVRAVNECDPLGTDHAFVLEAIAAFGSIGADEAVPTISALMVKRKWLARGKTRALKRAAVGALAKIGSPAAAHALGSAAESGDRTLRQLIKIARRR